MTHSLYKSLYLNEQVMIAQLVAIHRALVFADGERIFFGKDNRRTVWTHNLIWLHLALCQLLRVRTGWTIHPPKSDQNDKRKILISPSV
jgi:hypothetical protein